ncbi:Kinase binding protein CGI-121 [uncultured archaeon]|nr:Kinase binding protein CGI-121 [uncultured archaeon]
MPRMIEIRLFFGRPVIRDRAKLLSALREMKERTGCVVQALDADRIISERHISFAAMKAMNAFSEERNIAKDEGMEIMRYASGERQIERALTIGIADSTRRLALILVSSGEKSRWPAAAELSAVIEPDGLGCLFRREDIKEVFHISPEELEVVGEERMEDLVIERVALVDTYR